MEEGGEEEEEEEEEEKEEKEEGGAGKQAATTSNPSASASAGATAGASDVHIDIDACIFDRVLLFLEHSSATVASTTALANSSLSAAATNASNFVSSGIETAVQVIGTVVGSYKFDPLVAPDLLAAAQYLGLQALQDHCNQVSMHICMPARALCVCLCMCVCVWCVSVLCERRVAPRSSKKEKG